MKTVTNIPTNEVSVNSTGGLSEEQKEHNTTVISCLGSIIDNQLKMIEILAVMADYDDSL